MDEQLHALYPELVELGELATVIAAEAVHQRPGASATREWTLKATSRFWASAEKEDRAVQVTIAVRHRLFMADFWDKGVQVGSLSSPDLGTVAGAIRTFLTDRMPASTMTNAFSEFTPTPQAHSHEVGAMDEVAFQWNEVKRTLEAEAPELLPLADTLSRTWPFSHLFPTVSLEALCFSRCTGTPYSGDCPSVVWLSPGHYEVRTRGGNEPIGGGDEATALNLLRAALPPGCGPAVQGSAETSS